jgi:hypothetical protein
LQVAVAGGGDSAHFTVPRPAEQYPYLTDPDPAHLGAFKLTLLQNRGELVGPAPLEGVAIHPQPIVVGELPA